MIYHLNIALIILILLVALANAQDANEKWHLEMQREQRQQQQLQQQLDQQRLLDQTWRSIERRRVEQEQQLPLYNWMERSNDR